MRFIALLGASSALMFTGCVIDEANSSLESLPTEWSERDGTLSPTFNEPVEADGALAAPGSRRARAGDHTGFGDTAVAPADVGDQHVAVVLLGGEGGSELAYVSSEGAVSYRALPPLLSGAQRLLADGEDLLLISLGHYVRLSPEGATTESIRVPSGRVAVSAPGEVTTAAEFSTKTFSLDTGEQIGWGTSTATCWTGVGGSALGGALASDMFSDSIFHVDADTLSAVRLGETLGWGQKKEQGLDGVVWQAQGGVVQAGFGDEAETWSTPDQVVRLVPLGRSIAAVIETMSSERDSRLSIFTDEGEEVIATFPGAVMFDATSVVR